MTHSHPNLRAYFRTRDTLHWAADENALRVLYEIARGNDTMER